MGTLVVGFLFAYYAQPYTVDSLRWLGVQGHATRLRDYNEYILVSSVALLWLPILVLALLGKRDLAHYGLTRGEVKRGLLYALGMYAAMLPLLYFALQRPEFRAYYPLDKRTLTDPAYAVYFQLVYGYYLFCWEFFFRGFLTFGLYRWLGWWGIGLQAAAFALLHYGKPTLEVIGSFFAALVLSWVALRVKSFLPCFWTHWAVHTTFEVALILQHHG
ncbi:MAG: CPBP family intramembrane metalloprotease [Fimbriimonadales bacterium]|nr:CPBP family intramembrane metalloprotease [Fimbriimonadales bacterium]MDW8052653.1 CPBP family intramembrane glutamic endopeptidase [Armatimonadota bacterium]